MWADYHEFGGDPCNKTRKYIEVHYFCHDGTAEGTILIFKQTKGELTDQPKYATGRESDVFSEGTRGIATYANEAYKVRGDPLSNG